MVMQHDGRRSWKLGFALVSLLGFGACADVDAETANELGESQDLAQLYPSDAGTAHEDLGKGTGSDVATIGDSWMHNTLGTGTAISGALGRAGYRYQNYAIQGTEELADSLFGKSIPHQFDDAIKRQRDLKTVIMTGGGNDILISGPADCPRGGPQCTAKLGKIKDSLVELWTKMAAAGVQDVVYVGYAEGAGGNKAPKEFANAMKSGVGAACLAMTALRCHVIESTPIVKNRLILDGIHPTQAANDDLAKSIIELMNAQGIRR